MFAALQHDEEQAEEELLTLGQFLAKKAQNNNATI